MGRFDKNTRKENGHKAQGRFVITLIITSIIFFSVGVLLSTFIFQKNSAASVSTPPPQSTAGKHTAETIILSSQNEVTVSPGYIREGGISNVDIPNNEDGFVVREVFSCPPNAGIRIGENEAVCVVPEAEEDYDSKNNIRRAYKEALSRVSPLLEKELGLHLHPFMVVFWKRNAPQYPNFRYPYAPVAFSSADAAAEIVRIALRQNHVYLPLALETGFEYWFPSAYTKQNESKNDLLPANQLPPLLLGWRPSDMDGGADNVTESNYVQALWSAWKEQDAVRQVFSEIALKKGDVIDFQKLARIYASGITAMESMGVSFHSMGEKDIGVKSGDTDSHTNNKIIYSAGVPVLVRNHKEANEFIRNFRESEKSCMVLVPSQPYPFTSKIDISFPSERTGFLVISFRNISKWGVMVDWGTGKRYPHEDGIYYIPGKFQHLTIRAKTLPEVGGLCVSVALLPDENPWDRGEFRENLHSSGTHHQRMNGIIRPSKIIVNWPLQTYAWVVTPDGRYVKYSPSIFIGEEDSKAPIDSSEILLFALSPFEKPWNR